MAGRECKEMADALKLYDKRVDGTSVRDVAVKAGVSHTGLYAAIKRRAESTNRLVKYRHERR